MPHRVTLRGRPRQIYVYSGRSVLITDLDGEVRGSKLGFFADNTRVLSAEWLTVNGRNLHSIAVSPTGADAALGYYEVSAGDGVAARTVIVEKTVRVLEGLAVRLKATNYAVVGSASVAFAWHLAADFADADDAEQGESDVAGIDLSVETTWDTTSARLLFRSTHPEINDECSVSFRGAQATWDGDALLFAIDLGARESHEVMLAVEPTVAGREHPAPSARLAASSGLAKLRGELLAEAPSLRSSNAAVERAWATAVRDLASLPLGLPEGAAAPIAGLPKYQQFFGRDTLTIGWQSLLALRTPLRDSLRANAAWQGKIIDDWLDEEPGKMIHQARWGPTSRLRLNPFSRYYGDWATVPDFLVMLSQYLAWTADFRTVRELVPAARAAVGWLDRFADLDRDGFVEYRMRSEKGVKNQGWLDSGDAIVDELGRIVANPIATSELQAYTYAALQQAGLMFIVLGEVGYGATLIRRARRLRRRFDDSFWDEEMGTYVMGLGPGRQPIRSVSSNAGHLLAAGLVPRERGRQVARRLMERDMFSGWGIRTLSADHPAFNPFSYHRGSVWPVEQATIGFGFARYGAWSELHSLARAFFDTSELFIEGRLPEVVGGVQRDAEHEHPGVYPESCEPQGWSASAVVQMVQALLGMIPLAPARLLVLDPHLPEWLPDVRLAGVRIGSSKRDLAFVRTHDGRTRWKVSGGRGVLAVIRQPPPESPESTVLGRVRAVLGSPLGR
jgi:glycogen debranching enzyme